jgi:hypothetical protein
VEWRAHPERQGQPPPPVSWPVNGGGSAAFGLPAWRLTRMNAAEVLRASSSICARSLSAMASGIVAGFVCQILVQYSSF